MGKEKRNISFVLKTGQPLRSFRCSLEHSLFMRVASQPSSRILFFIVTSLIIWMLLSAFTFSGSGGSYQPADSVVSRQSASEIVVPNETHIEKSPDSSSSQRETPWPLITILSSALFGLIGIIFTLIRILFNRINKEIADINNSVADLKTKQLGSVESEEIFTKALTRALHECDSVKTEAKNVFGGDIINSESFNDTLENAIREHSPTRKAVEDIIHSEAIGVSSFNATLEAAIREQIPIRDAIIGVCDGFVREEKMPMILENLLCTNPGIQNRIKLTLGLSDLRLSILQKYADDKFEGIGRPISHNNNNNEVEVIKETHIDTMTPLTSKNNVDTPSFDNLDKSVSYEQ